MVRSYLSKLLQSAGLSSPFDNPSAGKFDPPGSRPPELPGTTPHRSKALAVIAFVLLALREGLRFSHYQLWGHSWLAPLAVLTLGTASFIVGRKRRAEIGRDNPYTATTPLTR